MSIQPVLRWAVYIPLFIIPFLPLYVANDLFFPFITGKGFAFRILVEFAFVAYAALAIADARYRPRFSWVFVLYGAFVLWMAVADALAINPEKAFWSNFERMEGWVTLIHVFLFFVVTSAVFSVDKLWRKWWLTVIAAAVIVCLYGLCQLGGACQIHQGSTRLDASMGNSAYLAAYLLFVLAATLWQAIESKGWLRYTLFVVAAVEAMIIFFTETRGAVLGLVGATVVGTFLWTLTARGKVRNIALGLLIALVVIAGGFYLVRESPIIQAQPTLARISQIGPGDLMVRATLWHMAFEGVAERPLTGWGQEGFNYIFNKFYEPSLYAQEPWFDRAHDVFIDWLVAGGIPALLLFLATLLMAAWVFFRVPASRAERILFICAIVAYGIQGIVVFDNLFTYIPLAAVLAMAHGLSNRPWKRLEALPAASETTMQMVAPVALVLAVVVVWFVNVPNIAAANELVRAITLPSSSGGQTNIGPNVELFQKALSEHPFAHQEVREQLVIFTSNIASQQTGTSTALSILGNFALGEMAKEVAAEPQDARLRLEYALGFRALGDNEDAFKQIEIAQQLSPKKQSTLVQEGMMYWQLGNTAQAKHYFDQAYQLDTSFPALAAYAAAGDIINGDIAGGKKLIQETYGTTTVDSEPLILAYYQTHQYQDLISTLALQVADQGGAAQARFRLAAAYAAAGDYRSARAQIEEAVAEHPEVAADAAQLLAHIPGGK